MDFNRHIVKADTSLHAAIEALNKLAAPNIFLVVVDDEFRVLGTVTDGDVRRAFLQGTAAEACVSDCMSKSATTGTQGQSERNETLLRSLRTRPKFLPVVTHEGQLVDILTADVDLGDRAIGFVMAGGRGSRLGVLTENTPKPLIEVNGRPILSHVLDRLEATNIRKVFISVHYLSEQIEAFITERQNRAEIELVHEASPLGTAGAIGLVSQRLDLPTIVLNGDVITNLKIDALLNAHSRSGNAITIAVTRHDVEIPFGVVRHTDEGRFLGIEEKPTVSHFVSGGVYVLSPEACALVPRKRCTDMPDVVNLARDIGLKVGIFPVHEFWIDIGRPADLASARSVSNDNA